jgi:hypothetical protein
MVTASKGSFLVLEKCNNPGAMMMQVLISVDEDVGDAGDAGDASESCVGSSHCAYASDRKLGGEEHALGEWATPGGWSSPERSQNGGCCLWKRDARSSETKKGGRKWLGIKASTFPARKPRLRTREPSGVEGSGARRAEGGWRLDVNPLFIFLGVCLVEVFLTACPEASSEERAADSSGC